MMRRVYPGGGREDTLYIHRTHPGTMVGGVHPPGHHIEKDGRHIPTLRYTTHRETYTPKVYHTQGGYHPEVYQPWEATTP